MTRERAVLLVLDSVGGLACMVAAIDYWGEGQYVLASLLVWPPAAIIWPRVHREIVAGWHAWRS